MKRRAAFSLVELLVVVAIIGLLAGAILVALSGARGAAETARCLANLRTGWIACRQYANEHDGRGPAIGQPYAGPSNWALVVMAYSGSTEQGSSAYRVDSPLVCPSAARALGAAMTRTYAMNAAGHNRDSWNTDPDRFDDPLQPGDPPARIRLDLVALPSRAALLFDAARNQQTPPLPEDRCASVLDPRPEASHTDRWGMWHATSNSNRRTPTPAANAALIDGSVRAIERDAPWLADPLP